jgi:hypothetical protein
MLVVQRTDDAKLLLPGRDPHGRAINASELWVGAAELRPGRGKRSWGGGFSGRPELADLLWPALKELARGWGQSSVINAVAALRKFWRFLDQYEAVFPGKISREVLGGALGQLWLFPPQGVSAEPPDFATFSQVAQILSGALGRSEMHWPSAARPSSGEFKDAPNEEQARAAFHFLAERAKAIFRRWKRADQLASVGRNLLDVPRGQKGKDGRVLPFNPSEADLHATYRAAIERTGDAIPMASEINRLLGIKLKNGVPRWWHRTGCSFEDIQYGLYPSCADLFCLSQLFMARTGWNPSTVYALDISNGNWARQHGDPKNDIWVIESWKERSKGWQTTICRGRVLTAPYQIVRALLDRTRALREFLRRNPDRLITSANARIPPEAVAEFAEGVLWLAPSTYRFTGRVVGISPRLPVKESSDWFRAQVETHNAEVQIKNMGIDAANAEISKANMIAAQEEERGIDHRKVPITPLRRKTEIPITFVPSDWRDVFATHVFQESRYSMIIVQWALGHKHLTSTRHYLRSRLWREYSEKRLLHAQEVIFDELGKGRCDPTILHARIELRLDPTREQLDRLAKFRLSQSSSGYLCPVPFAPPKEIDPGNPQDGRTLCRSGARCPGCPAGYAFNAERMVLRMVELELIRRSVSVVVWTDSQLSSDLDQLRIDLEQWPTQEVAQLRVQWEDEFRSGRRVLDPWSGMMN